MYFRLLLPEQSNPTSQQIHYVRNVSLRPKTYPEVTDTAGKKKKKVPEIMDIVIPGAKFVLF